MSRVLAVRLDADGDVLLTGPALRAVATGAGHLTLLHGPRGRQAAALLPGVDELVEFAAPWIEPATGVDPVEVERLVAVVRERAYDQAIVWTSFHQSPLPAALLLRMAGVGHVAAISDDYPGTLLDVRHRVGDGVHEVERALSLAAAAGHRLPAGDAGGLALRGPLPAPAGKPGGRYVVVHPGTSVPARAWAWQRHARLVRLLVEEGWEAVVTGSPGESALCARVAGAHGHDLSGRTTLAELAALLDGADALVAGNTGPAHLAAAVGTPVVSLFAPTVPPERWRPWGVAHALLGDHAIGCAGCRATDCPLPGHPCLDDVTPREVLDALRHLLADRDRTYEPGVARTS